MKHSFKKISKKVALFAFMVSFFAGLMAPTLSLAFPQAAAADSTPNIGYNTLQLVGEHCHDLHDDKYNFNIGTNVTPGLSECTSGSDVPGWQEMLEQSLNCSSDMFYQHNFTDPNDTSKITKTLWFTHIGAYKDCYEKAQTMFNNMTNTGPNGQCGLILQGSQNYTNCQTDVTNLHEALGCSLNMLSKTNQKDSQGDTYYTVDPGSGPVKDCLQRIGDVGKIQIIVFDGKGNEVKSDPISSASITPDTPDSPGGGSADTTGTAQLDCHAGWNILNWFVCGIVKGLVSVINGVDDIINSLLSVGTGDNSSSGDPSQIFNTSCGSNCVTGQDYYQAWSSFRDISLGLLVVVGLVMVISQAMDLELVDAYTIRKVLPRLIAMAIIITLSWALMRFVIQLFNDLGYGIRYLIEHPFSNLSNNIDLSGGGGVAVDLATGVAITALGIFGLLSFVATAALAVFVAFMVLIIRQVVVVALVIVAPVALLCYILPNTQRLYKVWFDSFSGALIMFPLIVALISAGRVFSAIANTNANAPGGNATFSPFIAFAAYFAPYFMIPMTFRLAGSMMGSIGGWVNGATQGAQKGLSRYRSGQVSKNARDLKNFERFSDRTPLGRGANTALGAAANPRSLLRGRAGVRTARQARQSVFGAEALKDNAIFQANQGDDKFLLALANRGLAQQKLDSSRKDFEKAQASGDMEGMLKAQATMDAQQHALDAAAQMGSLGRTTGVRDQALQALNKTGYQWSSGKAGYAELSDTVSSIYGDDQRTYAAKMNESQFNLKTAGRFDLGGINDGAGYDYAAGVSRANGYTAGQAKQDVFKAGAEHYFGVDANSDEIKNSDVMKSNLEAGLANGTLRTEDIAAYHAQLLDAKSSPIGVNKEHINRQLQVIEGLASETPKTDGELDSRVDLGDRVRQNHADQRRGLDPNLLEDNK